MISTKLGTNYSNDIWDKHDFLLNILTPESKGERNQLLVHERINRAKRKNVTKVIIICDKFLGLDIIVNGA